MGRRMPSDGDDKPNVQNGVATLESEASLANIKREIRRNPNAGE